MLLEYYLHIKIKVEHTRSIRVKVVNYLMSFKYQNKFQPKNALKYFEYK